MRTLECTAAVAAVCLLVAVPDLHGQGLGVMGGAHVNPDQVQGAVQYEFAPLTDRLRLRPAAGVGIGNDATLFTGNFDVIYEFKARRRNPWTFYAGGGPAINHYRLELYSETEAGVTVLGGMARGRWFTELRAGFFDSPDLTAAVGYRLTPKRQARNSRRGR